MIFKQASVVGAGTMGQGIAQVNAMAGIRSILIDVDSQALLKAKTSIEKNLEIGVEKGKISAELHQKTLALISYERNLDAASTSDLFIEAVPENMSLKREIFAHADAILSDTAMLATNTSSLSIKQIASATKRPESVIGLHFFNPPHIMKLLEIIHTEKTSSDNIIRAQHYAQSIGKTYILVKDAPGFATSRLGICLAYEAMRMVEQEIASPADIDKAMSLGYGHPVGPLRLTDMIGLDVRLAIGTYLHSELGSQGFAPPQILKDKVAAGHLGKKSGQGFYIWVGEKLATGSDLS